MFMLASKLGLESVNGTIDFYSVTVKDVDDSVDSFDKKRLIPQ